MSKKVVLWFLIIVCGTVLGAGAFIMSNMGTAFVGQAMVRLARTELGASLSFQELSGNPLTGYALKEGMLRKDSREILAFKELSVRVRLLPLLQRSFQLHTLKLRDFRVSPAELGALTGKDLSMVAPFGGSRMEVHQKGEDLDFDGALTYRKLLLQGEGTLRLGKDSSGALEAELGGADLTFGEEGEKGSLELRGTLTPRLALSAQLNSPGVEALLQDLELPLPISFTLPLELLLGILMEPGGDPEISGKVHLSGGHLEGVPLGESRGEFLFQNQKLQARVEPLLLGGIPFQGNGIYRLVPGNSMGGIFSLSLHTEKASLAGLQPFMPRGVVLQGTVEEGFIQLHNEQGHVEGDIQIHAPSVAVAGEKLEGLKMQVKLRKGPMLYVTSRAQGWGGSLALSGTGTFPGPSLDLSYNLKDLRLERLVSLKPSLKIKPLRGDISARGTLRGAPGSLRAQGEISSPKLAVPGGFVDGLKLPYSYQEKGDVLSIAKAGARWKGASLGLDATASALRGKSPFCKGELQLLSYPLQDLGALAPQLKDLGLKGDLTVKTSFSGSLFNPRIDGVCYVPALELPDGTLLRHARGEISLDTPALEDLKKGAPGELKCTLSARDARHPSGVLLENPKGTLIYHMDAQRLEIPSVEVRMDKGVLRGTGELVFNLKDVLRSTCAFSLKGENLDASRLYRDASGNHPLRGIVGLSVTGKGTFGNPEIAWNLSSPGVSFQNLGFQNLAVAGEARKEQVVLSEARGVMLGAPLEVHGGLRKEGALWNAKFEGSLKNLDFQKLYAQVPKLKDMRLKGKGTVTFAVQGPLAKIEASGNGASPSMEFLGLKGQNITLPFTVKDQIFRISEGRGAFYDGALDVDFQMALPQGKWFAKAKGSSLAMGPLLRDLTLSDKGLHCTGRVDFQGKGNTADGTLLGSGTFATSKGYLVGVPWVDLIASLHGGRRVSFREISGAYEVNEKRFLLKTGEALPEEGDPLYRYLRASGPVNYTGSLAINVDAMVNIQLLNALSGGLMGGTEALFQGSRSLEDLLKGVVGGVRDLGANQDFRKATFVVTGHVKDPKLKDLRVAETSAPEQPQGSDDSLRPGAPSRPQPTIQPQVQPTAEPQNLEEQLKKKVEEEIFKLFE